jgi:hypothetical protein
MACRYVAWDFRAKVFLAMDGESVNAALRRLGRALWKVLRQIPDEVYGD